jgi:ubiquinone biosynthesis protein
MSTFRRQTFRRAVFILRTLAPFLGLLLLRLARVKFSSAATVAALDARIARRLREAFERLGVIFIKLGQLLGVRADFLPPPYVAELGRLQDRVTPTPFSLVKTFLEAEFGRPLTAFLESFDETPLATASVGQVHCARFDGVEIVLKFLRPETLTLLDIDFRLLRLWARWGRRIDPRRQWKLIDDIINTIDAGFREESDFTVEREHAERIRRQLEGAPGVYVPATIPELCTRNVLALEYCAGARISDIEQLDRWGLDGDEILNRLVELYARMMLLDGYYHADPHPGNFLVKPDGTLILLDFGLVQRLSDETRQVLYDAAQAAITGNLVGVVHCLYDSGMLSRDVPFEDARQFVIKFARLSVSINDTRARVRAIETLLNENAAMTFAIPADLLYAFRLVQMLEGVASNFRPGWNVIADGGKGLTAAFSAFMAERVVAENASPLKRLFGMMHFGLRTAAANFSERISILRRILAN